MAKLPNILGITNNYGLQPKVGNLFTMELEYVPGSSRDDALYKMQLDLVSAKRPSFAVQTINMQRLNMKYSVAAAPTGEAGQITVRFRDTIQNNISKIFYRWYRMIFDPVTGTMGYAQSYKTDGWIKVLDPLGNVIERWVFKGLFPTTIELGDLSYENAVSPLHVETTFAYDIVFLEDGHELKTPFPPTKRKADDTNQDWTADGSKKTNYKYDNSEKVRVVIPEGDNDISLEEG